MPQLTKLKFINVAIILLISISINNYTIVLTNVLEFGKRDAWISTLVGFVIATLFIGPIVYIMKKTNTANLFLWITEHYNKAIAVICQGIVAFFLAAQFFIAMRQALEWAEASFLPATPPIVLGIFFSLLAFIAAQSGLQTIVLCAGILVPLFLGISVLLAVQNIKNIDFNYLLPVMEFGGVPVLHGTLFGVAGLTEIILLLLVQQRLNEATKPSKIIWFQLIATILFVVVVTQSTITFGPVEAAKQKYAYYEQWRIIRFNRYIDHVDFYSVLQCVSATFIRLSFLLYLFGYMISGYRSPVNQKKSRMKKRTVNLVAMISLSVLVVVVVSLSSLSSGVYYLSNYLHIISPIVLVAFLFFIWLLVAMNSRKKSNSEHEDNEV